MSGLSRWVVLGALAAGVPLACSDEDDRPGGPLPGTGGSGGSAGGSGTAGSAGLDGGAASGGSAGASGSAGSAGVAGAGGSSGTTGVCGDGVSAAGEDCDGADLNGNDCSTVGFDTGTLACSASCTFDTSGCSGNEKCYDAKDNDGDTQWDCFDSDCSAACSSSCTSPPALADPSSVSGNTQGHANQSDASCGHPGFPSGPEVIYSFVAAQTGVLDVRLTSSKPLSVSVRTSCSSASSELGCKAGGKLVVPVSAGASLFIVVDGIEASDQGLYQLQIESRAIACGDGHRDGSEGCDDGNTSSGDGCSASCSVELSESEPNETTASADALTAPFFGVISSASDLDVISVSLAAGQTSIIADTFDFGDQACTWDELDSELTLLSAAGAVIASDDDSGSGLCAHLEKTGLSAGNYYLRVQAASGGSTPTFPYRLVVSKQ